MKARHPEAILLSRVGDFYEAYGEDAETIARALQIALTSKEAGGGQRVAMAGVPHHALERLSGKARAAALHRRARRAARGAAAEPARTPRRRPSGDARNADRRAAARRQAEQLSRGGRAGGRDLCDRIRRRFDGLFARRPQSRARTPTTNCSPSWRASAPAEIVADVPGEMRATIAAAVESAGARLAATGARPGRGARASGLAGFSLDESLAIHRALDALRGFVKRTGVSNGERGARRAAELYRRQEFLVARSRYAQASRADARAGAQSARDAAGDARSLRDLDGIADAGALDSRAAGRGRDRSRSAKRRSLRSSSEHARRESLREILRGVFDLERIAQKVRFRRAHPRDLASLRRTLEMIEPLRGAAVAPIAPLLDCVEDFAELRRDLRTHARRRAAGADRRRRRRCGPRPIPSLRSASRCAPTRARDSPHSRSASGSGPASKALKVKYASTFGYAIEVSKSHAGAVPADYVRKQTLTTGERYVTPELKELELAISTAQARQERLERQLFDALVERVAARSRRTLARRLTRSPKSTRSARSRSAPPSADTCGRTFVDESVVAIEEGRHPVMEALLSASFVPNDLQLRVGDHRFILLTGPNMGGKSTYLRQAGLLDDHGADRLVRSGQDDEARCRRPDLHAHRCGRRPRLGAVDLLHGDGRGGEHPAPQHVALAAADRRGRARHRERSTGLRSPRRSASSCWAWRSRRRWCSLRRTSTSCARLPIIGGSSRTITSRRWKTPRATARRSFRIASSPEAPRARSASRSREWPGCRMP